MVLLNQLLPLIYHIEFAKEVSDIFQEKHFGEGLLVKKALFFICHLSLGDSLEDYTQLLHKL